MAQIFELLRVASHAGHNYYTAAGDVGMKLNLMNLRRRHAMTNALKFFLFAFAKH
jgi:hypothetical protein